MWVSVAQLGKPLDLAPHGPGERLERDVLARRVKLGVAAREQVEHVGHRLGEPPVERELIGRARRDHPAALVTVRVPAEPGRRARVADVEQEQHVRQTREVGRAPHPVIDLAVGVVPAVGPDHVECTGVAYVAVAEDVYQQDVIGRHPLGGTPDGTGHPLGRRHGLAVQSGA